MPADPTNSLRRNLPATKWTGQVGQADPVTFDLTPFSRLLGATVKLVSTRAATVTQANQGPLVTDFGSDIVFRFSTNAQRVIEVGAYYGLGGINYLEDIKQSGLVRYVQAGNNNLSAVPVLIGSAADTAQRALITANVACQAIFQLPIAFAEYFRKLIGQGDLLAWPTTYTGGVKIADCALEVKTQATATAPAGATVQSCTLMVQHDDLTLDPGSFPDVSKWYRYNVRYSAVGQVECVTPQFSLRAGRLQQVSFYVQPGDVIDSLTVKLGKREVKIITRDDMVDVLERAGLNVLSCPTNLFHWVLDMNDNTYSALSLDPTTELSILPNIATANGTVLKVFTKYLGKPDTAN